MARRTLYTVLEETAARYGSAPAMHQPTVGKSSGAKYRTYNWLEYKEAAQQITCGLRQLGIGKGDVVALHAEASAAFYMADVGIVSNGSIAAALYTSLPPSDHVRTLVAVNPKALIVEDAKTLRALRNAGVAAPLWILLSGEGEDAITIEFDKACVSLSQPVVSAPSGPQSSNQYTLTWNEASSSDDQWEVVELIEGVVQSTQIVTVPSATFSHTVNAPTTYTYRVRATNLCNEFSAVAEAYVQVFPPGYVPPARNPNFNFDDNADLLWWYSPPRRHFT